MLLQAPLSTEAGRTLGRNERMKDELYEALEEALVELDVLPQDEDGFLIGVYAVMDDLQRAMLRVRKVDQARLARSA